MTLNTLFRVLVATVAPAFLAAALFAPVAWADEGPVAVRAVAQYPSVAQGGKLVIAVEMDHKEHYHTWPAKEVKLPESIEEFAIRTEIGFPKGKDEPAMPSWIVLDGVQYPVAKSGKVADPTGAKPTVEVPLYSGKAVSFMRLEVKPDAPLGMQTFGVVVSFQSCNEETCTAPQDVTIVVGVRVVAKSTAELGAANEKSLFEKYDATKWGAGDPPGSSVKPVENPVPPPPSTSRSNALILFLFGAIGGFVLNLTPCVLPVIPIKVLTLSKHAGSKGRALILGIWMALGVVSFWTLAGIPMAFVSASLDPSRFIFGIWWVTLSISLIIAIMGMGIMGLFTISLPQSVYTVDAKADSPGGSFLFGVLTAVLGLPCFGFVVGGLLAGASTLPWYAIMAVFVGMGVGMAAPYLVLAVYPQLLRFIPRTGPASELVKQVMGLLLLAAAAYFATAGIKAVLSDFPYVEGSIAWWAVAFFVAVACVWMVARTFQIAKSLWPKVFFPFLAIIMVLGIGVFAQGKFRDDRDNYLALRSAMKSAGPASGTVPSGVWLPYTPELFAAVRDSGRSVFLDFTADWCINCKALKSLLLVQNPVLARLKSSDIVLMEVDCTSTRASGWDLLKHLGRTGVPTWVVYGPGKDAQPVVLDLTTPTHQTILDALDRAAVPATGSPVTSSR